MKLKKGLGPVSIDKENWIYVDARSITLVHEVRRSTGGYIRTDQIKIPARVLAKLLTQNQTR